PDASAVDLGRVFETRVKQTLIQGRTVYTAYDPVGGDPTGYATAMSGPGFWGPISAMVAVDGEVSKIIGIEFFRLEETPGLGARITEPRFENQFIGLSLVLAPGEKAFFSITAPSPGKSALELDAITGATSTSRAVEVFLNSGLQRFLKEFRENNEKR
ncbi:MAG: FMN-binding protein, partial [Thermodesulfobacteriota bacterium]